MISFRLNLLDSFTFELIAEEHAPHFSPVVKFLDVVFHRYLKHQDFSPKQLHQIFRIDDIYVQYRQLRYKSNKLRAENELTRSQCNELASFNSRSLAPSSL